VPRDLPMRLATKVGAEEGLPFSSGHVAQRCLHALTGSTLARLLRRACLIGRRPCVLHQDLMEWAGGVLPHVVHRMAVNERQQPGPHRRPCRWISLRPRPHRMEHVDKHARGLLVVGEDAQRLNLRRRLERFPAYHQRAVSIARTLAAVPGIAITPDPPQTRMMHVYLHGERALLEAAALDIARAERVALFPHLRPTDVPGWSLFELSIGDAAAALTDAQIGAYFSSLPLTR